MAKKKKVVLKEIWDFEEVENHIDKLKSDLNAIDSTASETISKGYCKADCTTAKYLIQLCGDLRTYISHEEKYLDYMKKLLEFTSPNGDYFETTYPPSEGYPTYKK